MPTIIDSLFLELGIDTSKFSKDQRDALAKISQFEAKAKKSGKGAGDAIKTVGEAFKDLAKESRVGASAAGIDTLAKKLTTLGKSAQVAGILGGGVAEGIGMLLSPAALGAAAVGALGLEMWDLNKAMSAANSTIDRQSQLSDMNAKSLWSWGEAAKTVGANPQDVTGGISSVQKSIAGMMIGAGDATPQLVALARLGVGWNAQSGLTDAQVTRMFTRAHEKAKALGYKNLGGLSALLDPIMNDAMKAIAFNPNFDPGQLKKQIEASAPANLNQILQDSLKSQMALGKLSIDQDILKETAYGGTQALMTASVDILRGILGGITKLVDYFLNPVSTTKKIYDAAVDVTSRGIDKWVGFTKSFATPSASHQRMSSAMKFFMDHGIAKDDAEAIVGNLATESSMNPLARNASGHAGFAQWDKSRQADFVKRHGYQIGSSAVSPDQQAKDEQQFVLDELQTTQRQTLAAMAKAKDLMGKTRAFRDLYERPGPGDNSLGRRYAYALDAAQLANITNMVNATSSRPSSVSHTLTSETHIGDVHLHTPATDPKAHADAFRNGISDLPLMNAADLSKLGLSTFGAQ